MFNIMWRCCMYLTGQNPCPITKRRIRRGWQRTVEQLKFLIKQKIATVNIFTLSYKSLLKAEADLNVYLPLEQILNCKWVHFTMKTVIFYIPFWYNNCWCAVVVIHFYLQWKKRGDFLIDFVIFFKNQSMTWTPSYLFYEYLKIQAFNLEPFYKE